MMAASPSDSSTNHLKAVAGAIRRNPMQALSIGFLAGFVIGGGQQSRAGQGLIGIAARLMVRQAVINGLAEVIGNHERNN
jgi:hypothetical protein